MGFSYVLKNANGEYLSDIKALGNRDFEKTFTKDLSKAKIFLEQNKENYREDVGLFDGEVFVRFFDEKERIGGK